MKKNNTTSGCLTIFAAIVAIAVVIFFIALAMPLMLILGSFGIWYYSKKYPNTKRQKVAIAVTLIGLIGSFTVTPWVFNSINTKSEQTQTTISSSSHSSDSSSFSSSKINDSSTSEEKEKQEKEREEQARKEAEAKQIAEAADQAVQQLENNPVQENISLAQAAVEHVVDPTTKASLTERIVQAQNTINQRAEEARQEAERQAAEQQQTRTVYVARFGKADVYWYSMENMPSNTRFDRVITMTEADAIASGKRHTSKE
ncbi:hypothetical protein [Streptococcus cristatus]|uniref:hypothetical protein n=1 Tax=Streptococcus cristatus TaxID=45634 RepID=UPI0028D37109|nr:hypothetical protein [Streptococcus cristatus]